MRSCELQIWHTCPKGQCRQNAWKFIFERGRGHRHV